MSGQRARSAIPAEHRSALPQLPGLPWWGAVLLAVTATAIGFAFDAGSGTKTLSAAFTVCYVTGCILAVLAVRQSGLFTAVIQPALILFVAVPSAFFGFHGSEIKGIKDVLINCGYPLIERFPLMFFTAATVLVIGVARWYLNTLARRHEPEDGVEPDDEPTPSRSSRRTAARAAAAEAAPAETSSRRSRRHSVEQSTDVPDDEAAPRPRRTRTTTTASRSRHARPPETEVIDSVQARPRRPRPPVDAGAEPRRRPRTEDARDRRNLPPVERRSAQDRPERVSRRDRTERPVRRDREERYDRGDRGDRDDRYERPERAARAERRSRLPDYEPYENYDGYRPSAGATSSTGTNGSGTHHPVSRVRYRGSDADPTPDPARDEPRTPQRRSRRADADSWEYDV